MHPVKTNPFMQMKTVAELTSSPSLISCEFEVASSRAKIVGTIIHIAQIKSKKELASFPDRPQFETASNLGSTAILRISGLPQAAETISDIRRNHNSIKISAMSIPLFRTTFEIFDSAA
jgi:hypothetical protein